MKGKIFTIMGIVLALAVVLYTFSCVSSTVQIRIPVMFIGITLGLILTAIGEILDNIQKK